MYTKELLTKARQARLDKVSALEADIDGFKDKECKECKAVMAKKSAITRDCTIITALLLLPTGIDIPDDVVALGERLSVFNAEGRPNNKWQSIIEAHKGKCIADILMSYDIKKKDLLTKIAECGYSVDTNSVIVSAPLKAPAPSVA